MEGILLKGNLHGNTILTESSQMLWRNKPGSGRNATAQEKHKA
jgi:hypothetical protein